MRVCVLIPVYDHGSTMPALIEALRPTGLEVLLVDDGSAEPTRRTLEDLAKGESHVWLVQHTHNRGKGAAVTTGFRAAADRGFTHVVQIDADGQHEARDVPAFVRAMEQAPEALVLGAPRFDASVPRSRLYGRQISRALVWLFTLSFEVDDPLCGFRGIPLAPTLALLDAERLGDRMDFDPELAVRLVWAGAPVVGVSTPVRYPEGGLSHFDVVWDDLRLAWLYVRLFLGWIVRAPGLITRRRRS